MTRLRIATRKSPLARWQAEHVAGLLRQQDAGVETEFVEIATKGDKILDAPLASVGGKGLFVKEIEDALLDGRADLAVHSLKDVPADLPAGLVIAAFPRREDPRDAFVSGRVTRLSDLPEGARVGTASLRRACQLKAVRPDLEIATLRGNVQTRVRKIREELDGGVLAYAGLLRLGIAAEAREVLDAAVMLPAVGQGALAVEIRADDAAVRGRVGPLTDAATSDAVLAERAFLRRLGGSCQVPVAAHAVIAGDLLVLRGLVGWPDGHGVLRGERRGGRAAAAEVGVALAEELAAKGAAQIVAALQGQDARRVLAREA